MIKFGSFEPVPLSVKVQALNVKRETLNVKASQNAYVF